MKKSHKILIVFLLVLALPVIFFTTRLLIVQSQFAAHPTGAITPELRAVRDGFANMYVLEKNGAYAVVDAGKSLQNVKAAFQELGIDPALVSIVLLTHTDLDHIGAVALFPNAQVYISGAEERMIDGSVTRFPFYHNKLAHPYLLLQDGQTVTLDQWQVQTQVVPGHTVGSAFFYIDSQYMFVGDTALKDGRLYPFTDLFSMNRAEQAKNLEKLVIPSGIELILTGHYGIAPNRQ